MTSSIRIKIEDTHNLRLQHYLYYIHFFIYIITHLYYYAFLAALSPSRISLGVKYFAPLV